MIQARKIEESEVRNCDTWAVKIYYTLGYPIHPTPYPDNHHTLPTPVPSRPILPYPNLIPPQAYHPHYYPYPTHPIPTSLPLSPHPLPIHRNLPDPSLPHPTSPHSTRYSTHTTPHPNFTAPQPTPPNPPSQTAPFTQSQPESRKAAVLYGTLVYAHFAQRVTISPKLPISYFSTLL